MSAISISNAVDWLHREKREAEYMEIVGRYEKKEVDLFPRMMFHLVEELERHADAPYDVLGAIYHELELHNKYKGQFFTPQNVCDMMGLMLFSKNDPDIESKGYITVAEPCCGAGAMILGFAKAVIKNGYSHNTQMVVTATDVDLKCVYMCYLQLSLYGIPAVVIHANSLTLDEWSRWYTPVYMLDGWIWKHSCGNIEKRYAEDEAIKQVSDPMYTAIRKAESAIEEITHDVTDTTQSEEQKPHITLQQAQLDGEFSPNAHMKKARLPSQSTSKKPAKVETQMEQLQLTLF